MSGSLGPGEGALRASEARFRALFDRAPIGLVQGDGLGRILARTGPSRRSSATTSRNSAG